MTFDRFSKRLTLKVGTLTLGVVALSLALTHQGYYAVSVLFTLIVVYLMVDLYRYVSRTNIELSQFLQAARFDDFNQHVQVPAQSAAQSSTQSTSKSNMSSLTDPTNNSAGIKDAGFDQLASTMNMITQQIITSRQSQQAQIRHLKSQTEHIPVPLISLYSDGKIQLHNNAARHLFAGTKVTKTDDLKQFGDDFYDALINLSPGKRALLSCNIDGDDKQLSVMMSNIVTHGESSSLNENLISLQDIKAELDGVQVQAWEDLVRVLTHEIMNSITPVSSLANTTVELVDDLRQSIAANVSPENILADLDDLQSAVKTVARRSQSLTSFVQSYRSMSCLPTADKSPLLVKELFDRVNELMSEHFTAQRIEFNCEIEPMNLKLLADSDLIEQLLINLLKNAEQAFPTDHQKPRIKLTARLSQRGETLIDVEDNGPGIPLDIASQIFLPFFTTKQQGSGIGLALSRQIMIAHHGKIKLSDSPLGGARFSLIFGG